MIPDAHHTHTHTDTHCCAEGNADVEKTLLIVLALQCDFASSAHVKNPCPYVEQCLY